MAMRRNGTSLFERPMLAALWHRSAQKTPVPVAQRWTLWFLMTLYDSKSTWESTDSVEGLGTSQTVTRFGRYKVGVIFVTISIYTFYRYLYVGRL